MLSSVFLLSYHGGAVCFLCVLVLVRVRCFAVLPLCLLRLRRLLRLSVPCAAVFPFCAARRLGPVFLLLLLLLPSTELCLSDMAFLPVAVGLLLYFRFLPVFYSTSQGNFIDPRSCFLLFVALVLRRLLAFFCRLSCFAFSVLRLLPWLALFDVGIFFFSCCFLCGGWVLLLLLFTLPSFSPLLSAISWAEFWSWL